MSTGHHKSVAVIGAGLGGLSAAIRLAHRGFEVRVFEKNRLPGGKMSEFREGGYRFDTGPSVLTMPFVLDTLFADAGRRREDYLDIVPLDPLCRYFWNDGASLDASVDIPTMMTEMRRFSESDAASYARFLNYSRRIYDITADIFLNTPIHERRHLLRALDLPTLLKFPLIDPLRTLHQGVRRFFSDKRIVQLFDRFATYNGSDPYQAPATLNVIPHVEHGMGSFYVRGGVYRVVDALCTLASELGVTFHYGTPVEKILHRAGRLVGLRIAGETVSADYVVCNGDVVTAANTLIDGFEKRRRRLNRLEPSLSGMVFLWGVRRRHAQLAHHNIIFSNDYRAEFRQIFDDRAAPSDPTIYIAITAKSDRDHAPDGAENWFVLLNMPYLADHQDLAKDRQRLRQVVLKKLRGMNLAIDDAIEVEKTFTPQDFYSLYGSNRGSIYGLSSNSRWTAFKRPANRSREINGLYFAGGATHPGGGIPLVLRSGKMCADLIIEAANGLPHGTLDAIKSQAMDSKKQQIQA